MRVLSWLGLVVPFALLPVWSCTKPSGSPNGSETRAPEGDRQARRKMPESITIWKTISRMDPGKSVLPDDVKGLVGKEVAVVGFVIPNDAAAIDEMHEFLLTPMAGGCIHVPPPPPNYVVHVSLPEGKKTKIPFGAVEVRGKLTLPRRDKDRQMYSFEMLAYSVDDFDASTYMRY